MYDRMAKETQDAQRTAIESRRAAEVAREQEERDFLASLSQENRLQWMMHKDQMSALASQERMQREAIAAEERNAAQAAKAQVRAAYLRSLQAAPSTTVNVGTPATHEDRPLIYRWTRSRGVAE